MKMNNKHYYVPLIAINSEKYKSSMGTTFFGMIFLEKFREKKTILAVKFSFLYKPVYS